MIKAVIFDFYSVLAVRGTGSFRKTHFPADPTKMKEAGELADKLSMGSISYDDFIDGLAELGKVSRETVLKYTEDYKPNGELLDYIHNQLKPKYLLGIISNAGDDRVATILGEDNKKLFNDILLSYEAGVIKPEPAIYEMSAHNLGVKTHECVFVDDILTFCQGAEAVGMNTIWYKDFEQVKSELEKILAADTNK